MLEFVFLVYDICRNIADTNLMQLLISVLSISTLVLVKQCINERFKQVYCYFAVYSSINFRKNQFSAQTSVPCVEVIASKHVELIRLNHIKQAYNPICQIASSGRRQLLAHLTNQVTIPAVLLTGLLLYRTNCFFPKVAVIITSILFSLLICC